MNLPTVIINGVTLTPEQAKTVHCALGAFACELIQERSDRITVHWKQQKKDFLKEIDTIKSIYSNNLYKF